MRISDWSSDVCSSDLSCETIRQAPAIDLPLPKVMASSALLAHLVVSRFVDHQPWHRQSVILRRQVVEIDRDVMGRWSRKLAWLMAPLGERLLAHILEAPKIRSEEHTSELQSLMRISYAVFFLQQKQE